MNGDGPENLQWRDVTVKVSAMLMKVVVFFWRERTRTEIFYRISRFPCDRYVAAGLCFARSSRLEEFGAVHGSVV